MDEKILKEQHQYILSLLYEQRLNEAIQELEALYIDHPSDELTNIKTPFMYMLKYMLEGAQDPHRYQLLNQLIKDTIEYTDKVFFQELDMVSSSIYHTKRRENNKRLKNTSYTSLITHLEAFVDELAINKLVKDTSLLDSSLRKHEESLGDLFMKTWLSDFWSNGEKEEATKLLNSNLILESDKSLFISAVTLSLLQIFDPRKFAWLIEAYKKKLVFASPRALVGLVIVVHVQNQRLSYYPELNAQLSFLIESTHTAKLINSIFLQLLQAQETEKIDKKMREEIIPEMIKNASSMKNMKFGFEEDEGNDHNPDWQNALEESGLGDKIREINELQMQGADVYMSSFATLKGYPFFNAIQNWFYPFEKKHSSIYKEFGSDNKKGSVVDLILNSGLFCNSDKYSLCFTFQHIPQSQRDMMLSQLTEQQMGGLEDEQKIMKIQELAQDPAIITNQYIHDLYRFFKLYRYNRDFKDIFKSKFELHNLEQFNFIKKDSVYLNKLADFFLRNEHYHRAIEIFNLIKDINELSFELFQKKGYCHQKLKEYDSAITAFIKADMIKSDNVWTNRHLASCYRSTNQHQKALHYYEAVEKVQPKNLSVLFYIGMCHTSLKQYDEALQYFFKMDFIKPNSKRAWRAIAWCSFISNKHNQADKYYAQILAQKPIAIDYFNAAHVKWALGDLNNAVELYKLALKDYTKNEFIDLLNKDKAALIKQGIPEKDIPLLINLLD